jgi:hypothetical protein
MKTLKYCQEKELAFEAFLKQHRETAHAKYGKCDLYSLLITPGITQFSA